MRQTLGAIVVVCAAVSGCKAPPSGEQFEALEQKLAAAEARIAQLERSAQSKPDWVLWKRFQAAPDPQRRFVFGYAPPQAVSAYPDRPSCYTAARTLVVPGGQVVAEDPLSVQYPNGVQEFYCLPVGVTAGIAPAR